MSKQKKRQDDDEATDGVHGETTPEAGEGFAPGEGEGESHSGGKVPTAGAGHAGGRSESEMDPRRNEGSDPALLANKLIPRNDAAPASVAENPKKRSAKDIKWADDLIAALAETGTGGDKLAVIQRAKVEKFEEGENHGLPETDPNHKKRSNLPADHPKRHLTAKQALKALEDAPEVGEVTKQKARAICKSGTWAPGVVANPAVDAHIPAPPKDAAPADDEGDDDGAEEKPKRKRKSKDEE